jgi:hypothetical protein
MRAALKRPRAGPAAHVLALCARFAGPRRAGPGVLGWTGLAQEEERFHAMAREPDIFSKLSRSIAPSISGDYTTDIKRALAALLLAGSRKVRRRGVRGGRSPAAAR